MKRVIKEIKAAYPGTEEQDIKRAYWRQAKAFGVGADPVFQIRLYMETNKQLKP